MPIQHNQSAQIYMLKLATVKIVTYNYTDYNLIIYDLMLQETFSCKRILRGRLPHRPHRAVELDQSISNGSITRTPITISKSNEFLIPNTKSDFKDMETNTEMEYCITPTAKTFSLENKYFFRKAKTKSASSSQKKILLPVKFFDYAIPKTSGEVRREAKVYLRRYMHQPPICDYSPQRKAKNIIRFVLQKDLSTLSYHKNLS